jgi:beta-lactamase superfamily II metal-dependent hydrolase
MSSLFPLQTFQPPPQYLGIEVDMLSLGDADCILVTGWNSGIAQRVLVDGGNKNDAPKVRAFLAQRRVNYIDHVVCTHPHDDHAGGLVELLTDPKFVFGTFWMHQPWNHVDPRALEVALQTTSAKRVAKILWDSLKTQLAIIKALRLRGKIAIEPFAGQQIAFLTVCGPSAAFYKALVAEFTDLNKLAGFEQSMNAHEQQVFLEKFRALVTPLNNDGSALGGEATEPENDSSVVLATRYDNETVLFTADAGVPALEMVRRNYPVLQNCNWMQVPHHGSRRNLTEELVAWFRPKAAFVSAKGEDGHPRVKLVNAFTRTGTVFYSTHYPNGAHLWYRLGFVPARLDYGPATQLYNWQ